MLLRPFVPVDLLCFFFLSRVVLYIRSVKFLVYTNRSVFAVSIINNVTIQSCPLGTEHAAMRAGTPALIEERRIFDSSTGRLDAKECFKKLSSRSF